jgi:glycosyltransferase involved in cell wall biosynthesis
MPKLCLNMIVRNEAERIERALKSVAPFIEYWVIHDTGSTDDTVEVIEKFFAGRNIPGHVTHGQFKDFSQARNDALNAARQANYDWDYLLLCDADMELVVEDTKFTEQLRGGLAYNVVQRGSGLSYSNVRFINRAATGMYVGVTHEYLDIPPAGDIAGIWYNDHADGSNRSNKARRDIRLLRKDLRRDPNNGRSWFYLANSHKDEHSWEQAIAAYKKVVEVGSWVEEVWYSKYQMAHCYAAIGRKDKYVECLIDAYNYRPTRAEPLWDLAKHYREKGDNNASLLFSEPGIAIPYPSDMLFVQDFPYTTGLREEFSICGFYDDKRRERAYDMMNSLALDPKVPDFHRNMAKNNMFFCLEPLCKYMSSFSTRRIPFTPPDGWTPMNPSIEVLNDKIYCVIRTVNYTMDEHGRYLIKSTHGEANSTNPINTRNYLAEIDDRFRIDSVKEILPPEGFPPPAYDLVIGFEDTRLFAWRGGLWTTSNLREQNAEGWCEQWLAKLTENPHTYQLHYTDPKVIRPEGPKQNEKNWAAIVANHNHDLQFVYRLGEFLDPATGKITKRKTRYAADTLSGGTQYIPFRSGYLGVIHEAHVSPATNKRYYTHRFVYMGMEQAWTKVSRPFVFHDKVIEFAAGLAWHPDGKRIMISYGREDKEAWIATVEPQDVSDFLLHD